LEDDDQRTQLDCVIIIGSASIVLAYGLGHYLYDLIARQRLTNGQIDRVDVVSYVIASSLAESRVL
jgi:hypothetical protein